jgi:hypothetical protein
MGRLFSYLRYLGLSAVGGLNPRNTRKEDEELFLPQIKTDKNGYEKNILKTA